MSAWCLLSGNPRPCGPCTWHFSGLGSCRPLFYTFCRCPSCGTCDGEKSPVHCGMGRTGMLRRRLNPGSWQWPLCHSFWGGGLGRTPVAAVASATAWLAIRDSGSLPGGEPKAHLFVGVQRRRGDEGLFQAFSTAVAGVVVCNYYVVQI